MGRRNNHRSAAREKRSQRLEQSVHPHTRPGSIIVPLDSEEPILRVTCYGPDKLVDRPDCTVSQIAEMRGKYPIMWIDATGLGDAGLIEQIGKLLGLHPLSLENMVSIPQRSKVEEYPNHLFSVTQIPTFSDCLHMEQVSIFTARDFVLTWRERPGECFDLVRKRLQVTGGVTRSSGVDYLTYAILDAVVDSFFPVLETLGDEIDDLDERVDESSDLGLLARLQGIRYDVRQLRRIAWPLRDAIDFLVSKPGNVIRDETLIHLRDCHDHTVQIIDSLENCRDACGDIRDYNATAISNRMNEIMKVLTVISTVFIPLNFIAGVYGMNFDTTISKWNMPELEWRYGYLACLGLMAAVTVGQFVFFYRRGWLRRLDKPPKSERRGDDGLGASGR